MSLINSFRNKVLKHSLSDLYDYLYAMEKGINGDMVIDVTPATLGSSAATVNATIAGEDAKFTRKVRVIVKTSTGETCSFINGTFAIAVTENTAGNGVSAIAEGATTITISEGIGYIDINYTGTWAAADTQTLTITGGTKLGYTIANKTSVDTLIA